MRLHHECMHAEFNTNIGILYCTTGTSHIVTTPEPLYYYTLYRMAGNFGGGFIMADWRFCEQSANISSAKSLQCAVIIIRNHSFHVYNRPAAGRASVIVGMEFTIHSCVRGYHVSKGFWTPEVVSLSATYRGRLAACSLLPRRSGTIERN